MFVRSARPGKNLAKKSPKKETRGRPPHAPGLNAFDVRKHKVFAKALNVYAVKTIAELKAALADVEGRAAMEVMALKTLLSAAENGTLQAINLVLNTNSGPRRAWEHTNLIGAKGAPPEAEPELPDPGEFAPGDDDGLEGNRS